MALSIADYLLQLPEIYTLPKFRNYQGTAYSVTVCCLIMGAVPVS